MAVIAMSSGRLSRREAAWLVISDAERTSTAMSGRQTARIFRGIHEIAKATSAATKMPAPARKKLAPTTSLKLISAVPIKTFESTKRYKTCTTARPSAEARNNRKDECWTDSMPSRDVSDGLRATQSSNSTPPSRRDCPTRVAARSRTEKYSKRSASWWFTRRLTHSEGDFSPSHVPVGGEHIPLEFVSPGYEPCRVGLKVIRAGLFREIEGCG